MADRDGNRRRQVEIAVSETLKTLMCQISQHASRQIYKQRQFQFTTNQVSFQASRCLQQTSITAAHPCTLPEDMPPDSLLPNRARPFSAKMHHKPQSRSPTNPPIRQSIHSQSRRRTTVGSQAKLHQKKRFHSFREQINEDQLLGQIRNTKSNAEKKQEEWKAFFEKGSSEQNRTAALQARFKQQMEKKCVVYTSQGDCIEVGKSRKAGGRRMKVAFKSKEREDRPVEGSVLIRYNVSGEKHARPDESYDLEATPQCYFLRSVQAKYEIVNSEW